MRLTLVIPSLEAGGAERILTLLAGAWAARGREVTLVTTTDPQEDFYPVDPRVHRVRAGPRTSLGERPRGLSAAPWVRHLREAVRASRPDLVVSFLTRMNLMTLAACAGLQTKVIVGERLTHRWPFDPATRSLRRVLYPFAAGLVVQTEEERGWGIRLLPTDRVWAIPNPARAVTALASDVARSRTVLAMGRLDAQKGHDLLIEAFARCAPRNPEWRLVIVGEGPWRSRLEAQVARHGLRGRVSMPGLTSDPIDVMRQAGLFVLSSRMEGFPNVLLEAMACGLPVISFDCPSGPRDIVRHEVDGLLVPSGDVGLLAGAMHLLMSDDDGRLRLAVRAPEVVQRFSGEKFLARWEEALEAAARATPRRPTARDVFLPAMPRPEAEQAETERRFFADLRLLNGVYKTTSLHRLDDLNELVARHLPQDRPLELMDVAISTGVTTLEWMRSLDARGVAYRMVAGDLQTHAWLVSVGKCLHVLCDPSGHALHFELIGLSVYRGLRGLWKTPHLVPCAMVLRAAWRLIVWIGGGVPETRKQVSLISPRLTEYLGPGSIDLIEDDIVQEPPPRLRSRFHAVRAANILHREYFDDETLLRSLAHLRARLRPQGLLIVCRTGDDGAQHASVFRLREDGTLEETASLGGGSEIRDLVLRLRDLPRGL